MGDAPIQKAIKQGELSVGKMLPWPVYDSQGRLLYEAGVIIESESQLDGLVGQGYSIKPPPDVIPPKYYSTLAQENSNPAKDDKREQMVDLDSIRWNVGEKLFLQMQDNPAIRYTVRMVGFVKHKSITIQAPAADGGNPLVRDGEIFIARAFTGKKAYAFTTEALKSVFFPYPHLHLSYPSQVRSTVIRQGARVTVKIIASMFINATDSQAAIVINDLSTGGASGISKKLLGAKSDIGTIKFKVNAAGNDEFLDLSAIIRSVERAENEEGFRYGFQFTDLDSQQKLVLSAFVHQTLVESE